MPNIKAKDADGATIFLKSTKANSDEAPATSQEDLLDSLGLPADAASTTNGTLIAHTRAIRDRVPANLTVTSTRLLVDGSGVTQPISGTVTANTGLSQPLTDTELRATAVPISGTVTANTGLSQPLTDTELRATPVPVSGTVTANLGTLLTPGVARQLAAGSTSTNTALTNSCQRISILATGADIRYLIGSSSQTASATSHYIAAGERLDLGLPTTPNIAVIRAGSINGTLELTEFL